MFDALVPRLQTVTPPEGAAIYLKKIPSGQVVFKFKRGTDFDNPDHVAPADAAVTVLLKVLQQMHVPGIDPYISMLSIPSMAQLSPQDGLGILIKRLPDKRFAIKIQNPCDFDHPDAVAPTDASLKFLLNWITEALGR